MKPPLPRILSAVPRTPHAQLEIAKAIHTLMAPHEDELLQQRRAEIASLRGELEAIKRNLQKAGEECLALLKAEMRAAVATKYNPDQPRVPAGSSGGGRWTSGTGSEGPSDLPALPGAGASEPSAGRVQYASLENPSPGTRIDAAGGAGAATGGAHLLSAPRNDAVIPDMPYASEFPGGRADLVFDDPAGYHVISAYEIPDNHPKHPVPFVDSSGRQIYDDQGNSLLRPDDLTPEKYAEAGMAAHSLAADIHQFNEQAAAGLLEPSAMAGLAAKIASQLAPFTHGGSLDAERFDSYYVREYRHYTSIATGIFMAAAGVSREDALAFADFYASLKSKFGPSEMMDEAYAHSTKQDIEDNLKGYDLYESGRVRSKR
jgi:hypothetical protein